MISKLSDLEIPQNDPFANCQLGRKKYAEILTQIVSMYNNGCVLAINGEGGTGKTTFVKTWQQYLINKGLTTLYFNVWENDFISDPLVGLIGEFRELSSKYNIEDKFSKVTTTAGKIVLSMLPAVVEAIATKKRGKEAVDANKDGTKGTVDILEKEFQNYEEQKTSIAGFRKALTDFVSSCNSDKPLIFIVDELDRCNPTFAVKVLERIKHLFSIPNIVFVLSIDKKQLCNSIKGYYGSESLDAVNYLKRFIDIEYNLPEPDYEKFCNYLYWAFDIKVKLSRFFKDTDYFNEYASALFKQNNLSLRQKEKVYSLAGLALCCNKQIDSGAELFLILTLLKVCYNDIYVLLEHGAYKTPQEFVNVIEHLLPYANVSYQQRMSCYSFSYMLRAYFSKFGYADINKLIKKDEKGADTLIFDVTKLNVETVIAAVKYYSQREYYIEYVFDSITNLIDLLNSFE